MRGLSWYYVIYNRPDADVVVAALMLPRQLIDDCLVAKEECDFLLNCVKWSKLFKCNFY